MSMNKFNKPIFSNKHTPRSNYKKENKYEKTSHLSYSLNISKGLFVLIFD